MILTVAPRGIVMFGAAMSGAVEIRTSPSFQMGRFLWWRLGG